MTITVRPQAQNPLLSPDATQIAYGWADRLFVLTRSTGAVTEVGPFYCCGWRSNTIISRFAPEDYTHHRLWLHDLTTGTEAEVLGEVTNPRVSTVPQIVSSVPGPSRGSDRMALHFRDGLDVTPPGNVTMIERHDGDFHLYKDTDDNWSAVVKRTSDLAEVIRVPPSDDRMGVAYSRVFVSPETWNPWLMANTAAGVVVASQVGRWYFPRLDEYRLGITWNTDGLMVVWTGCMVGLRSFSLGRTLAGFISGSNERVLIFEGVPGKNNDLGVGPDGYVFAGNDDANQLLYGVLPFDTPFVEWVRPSEPVEPPIDPPKPDPLPPLGTFPVLPKMRMGIDWTRVPVEFTPPIGNADWSPRPDDPTPWQEDADYPAGIGPMLCGLKLTDNNEPPESVDKQIAYAQLHRAYAVNVCQDDESDTQTLNAALMIDRVNHNNLASIHTRHVVVDNRPTSWLAGSLHGYNGNLQTVGRDKAQVRRNVLWLLAQCAAGKVDLCMWTRWFACEDTELKAWLVAGMKTVVAPALFPGQPVPPIPVDPPSHVTPPLTRWQKLLLIFRNWGKRR